MTPPWPHKPFIYEINTAVWLNTLSRQAGRAITLANVPDEVIENLAALNVDAIWLMGIWQRSPAGRRSALNYIHEYRGALPDISEDDVIGSAYAIGRYQVDPAWGGREGLAEFRARLAERGLGLMLDFVPNHVAMDHPAILQNPAYFIIGTAEDARMYPGTFFPVDGAEYYAAHGRDPHFPAWIDTAQLNAFSPAGRRAALEALLDIASQCDGVRCDMAMLVMNEIFSRTWGHLPGPMPESEYWEDIIPEVKAQYPDFIFIAEAYWSLEYALLQQGFDFTYDKTMYDRLHHGHAPDIYIHLAADISFLERNMRFIENHDEPRAAADFGVEKSRAAAVLICTVPGAVLLHDGQLSGRRVKLPVQIKRQPDEKPNRALEIFYGRLLRELRDPIYQQGRWSLFEPRPLWDGSSSYTNLLAYGWRMDDSYRLIVINITPVWSHGIIRAEGWRELGKNDWRLYDALHDTYRFVSGQGLAREGLYVEMEPYTAHIFHMEPAEKVGQGNGSAHLHGHAG